MKNVLGIFFLSLLLTPIWGQSSVVVHLADEIALLEEGDSLVLSYSFEGCYGPYHHGTIHLVREENMIATLSKSYSNTSTEPFVEANLVRKNKLVQALDSAGDRESSEILGNVINFRIGSGATTYHEGRDRIGQRHFIELFHPFTTAIKPKEESLIPKISSGGFVH